MKNKEITTTVICDASWCPETGAGGWAAWATTTSSTGKVARQYLHGSFRDNPNGSLQAEVWAMKNGIHIAKKLMKQHRSGGVLLAQSDCVGAIKEVSEGIDDIVFRHVKGHTDNAGARFWVNRWCDRMARKSMRALREQLRKEMVTCNC